MNYWPKHIGPWLKATVTLSAAEEGIYGRLVDWCYAQEKPLPLQADEVHRIARCRDRGEKDTTDAMVSRFFIQTDSGWRHERIERELAKAHKRTNSNVESRTGTAERMRRYRARRRLLYQQAYALGVPPAAGIHASNEQLVEAIVQAGGKPRYTDGDVTRDVTVTPSLNAVTVTAVQTTELLSQYIEEGHDATVTSRVTRNGDGYTSAAGEVCKRMRATGMARVNPSDARLLELLQLGVDTEAIVLAASEAVARHKGFEWALVRCKGQWDDQQRERAEMLQWAPGLAKGGA